MVVGLVLCLGGAGFALNWWMTNSAYLGEVDGKVAVYQGIPGQVLGMGHSQLDQVTDVPLDALQPGTAARVREQDIRCESLEAARRLVNEYRMDAGLDEAPAAEPDAAGAEPGPAADAEPGPAAEPEPEPESAEPAGDAA